MLNNGCPIGLFSLDYISLNQLPIFYLCNHNLYTESNIIKFLRIPFYATLKLLFCVWLIHPEYLVTKNKKNNENELFISKYKIIERKKELIK